MGGLSVRGRTPAGGRACRWTSHYLKTPPGQPGPGSKRKPQAWESSSACPRKSSTSGVPSGFRTARGKGRDETPRPVDTSFQKEYKVSAHLHGNKVQPHFGSGPPPANPGGGDEAVCPPGISRHHHARDCGARPGERSHPVPAFPEQGKSLLGHPRGEVPR